MQTVLAILAVLGGILAFLFKRKSDKNAVNSVLAETAAKDKKLELSQEELEKAIAEIDANLEKIEIERAAKQKKDSEDSLSLSERRSRILKNLK